MYRVTAMCVSLSVCMFSSFSVITVLAIFKANLRLAEGERRSGSYQRSEQIVSCISFFLQRMPMRCMIIYSELESAVRRYSSGASSGAFSGKGQTLGGASTSMPQFESPGILAEVSKLDPQVKVLLYLLAGYLLFWYLS